MDRDLSCEFRLYLAYLDIKNKTPSIKKEQKIRLFNNNATTCIMPKSYQWIETLLPCLVAYWYSTCNQI